MAPFVTVCYLCFSSTPVIYPAPTRTCMRLSFLLAAVIAITVAGCGILYKQPNYPGNLLDKTAVDQLQFGMAWQQVPVLLGTTSFADPFHHDRSEYPEIARALCRERYVPYV